MDYEPQPVSPQTLMHVWGISDDNRHEHEAAHEALGLTMAIRFATQFEIWQRKRAERAAGRKPPPQHGYVSRLARIYAAMPYEAPQSAADDWGLD